MPIDPTEYERATAIISHATITRQVADAYPNLSIEDYDAMIIGIIDRMARMRGGWSVRREQMNVEEE